MRMHMCMCVCVCIRIRIRIRIRICMCICMCVYIYIYIHMRVYIYIYIYSANIRTISSLRLSLLGLLDSDFPERSSKVADNAVVSISRKPNLPTIIIPTNIA